MENKEKMERNGVAFLCLAFILLNFQRAHCNLSYEGPSTSTSSDIEQQEKDRVIDLPGLSFNLNSAHYAGFVTVDPGPGRALFYWFFEAVEGPSSKPLVLWLNGGPGCSSIGFGVAEEIGPFHIKPDGKTLYPNLYSWNQVANMLFLDSPVGSGYSYSNDSKDGLDNGDERTAKEALVFLEKWFERFPQYKGREFYIVGESYAGHFVPQLANEIMQSQEPAGETSINLKGYMVGNALTDDFHGHLGVFQFMWTAGMISDETYRLLNIFCVFQSFEHIAPDCQKIINIATEEHGDIDEFSIFAPTCTGVGQLLRRLLKSQHLTHHVGEEYDPCVEKYTTAYFNSPEVQRALHVDPALAPSKWEVCSDIIEDHWKDSAISVLNIYRKLINSGLRIWMFSGNTDAVMPVASTRYSIKALNLTALSPWRAWYHNEQVGGWTQDYEGLTYVTVRGSGHQVPRDKPELALAIIKAFLSGSPMPTLSKLTNF